MAIGAVGTEARRHPIVALFMQIGIRVHYLLLSWFCLRPLFMGVSSRPSPFRPKNCPKYDSVTKIGFTWLWFVAGIGRDDLTQLLYGVLVITGIIPVLNFVHQWLTNRLIKQFKEAGYNAKQEIPIPEFDWKNKTPEEFFQAFVTIKHPVVLRGFMNGTQLLKDLSWKTVMEKYSEEPVFLTKKELDGYEGLLKEVENPATYLHNSECLFNKYPHLRDLFQYEKLEPYLHMKPGYEQIFVGRGGTGTPFHHAAVFNMFYMIEGTKKWWFIDPYDTYMAYPITVFGKAAGALAVLWPGVGNTKDFPLFDLCPIHSIELQPGDVLFNPPFWWHAIKNTSDCSVAVASRWHTNGICGHNLMMTEEDYEVDRFSSMSFMLGPSSIKFMHNILQTPSPRFDEHTTLRERGNRFVHKQLQWNEKGGLTVLGVSSKF